MNQFLLYNSYIIGPFVNKNYQKKLSHQKTNKEINKQTKERKKETLIYLIFSFYLLATSWTFTFNWIYNGINNSVKYFWSWLDPKDFLWHADREKINSFFEHKIFFCVASSCFCRHEIFFCVQHQIVLSIPDYFFNNIKLFIWTQNCFCAH